MYLLQRESPSGLANTSIMAHTVISFFMVRTIKTLASAILKFMVQHWRLWSLNPQVLFMDYSQLCRKQQPFPVQRKELYSVVCDNLHRERLWKGLCVHARITEPLCCTSETNTALQIQFSSVQSLSCAQLLRPHESQHARPPCPSPTPGVQSDSRPSRQWCHPAISSWVVPFSSCPQCLPASGSFPMSQLFAWGGQILQ